MGIDLGNHHHAVSGFLGVYHPEVGRSSLRVRRL
jgi:hypothetical protein